jgi:hypothetical protein
MPSLNDIPENIRTSTNPIAFMNWVMPIPVTTQIKQALAAFWQRETRTKLGAENWKILLSYTPPRTKPNGT